MVHPALPVLVYRSLQVKRYHAIMDTVGWSSTCSTANGSSGETYYTWGS